MITLLYAAYTALAGAAGLALGSFAGVCIDRMPHDRSLLTPSCCDACGTRLGVRDLVPVVSWIARRGHCGYCGAPIPRNYVFLELLLGLFAVLMWRRIAPGLADVDPAHIAAFSVYLAFGTLLAVAAFVDARHRIVPDETSIYAVPFAILAIFGLDTIGHHGWPPHNWQMSVLGAAMFAVGFGLVGLFVGYVMRTEALGWGDVKLVALIAAVLGVFPGGFVALLVGAALAVVFAFGHLAITWRRGYFPAAPFLAMGAVLWLLQGDVLVRWLIPGIIIVDGEVKLNTELDP